MLALKKKKIKYNFISTGQHSIVKSQVLSFFKLPKPDVILYDGPEFTSIVKMLIWFNKLLFSSLFHKRQIFKNDENGFVVVHGDAISTLLGTLIAKLAGMKVIHVEAGIRSGRLFNPFPEEITRSIVSFFSDIDFCTGKKSCENVRRYSHRKKIVNIHENTLYDSFSIVMKKKRRVNKYPKKYFIFILHRTENLLNKKLVADLVSYLRRASKNLPCVYIVHPTSKSVLKKYGLWNSISKSKQIHVYDRLSYHEFMSCLSNSEFICTDGGGNQQECTYLGLPILTLRTLADSHEGLGKNVVVSRLNFDIIDDFFINYKKYKTSPFKPKKSPTQIIMETFKSQKVI